MYGRILIFLFLLVAIYLGVDFLRFYRASKKPGKGEGYKVDAGGLLSVQGGRTYYTMPSGTRRKIADFEFDLTPGSADMRAFLGVMDKAKRESQSEASNKRKVALTNMRKVADDVARS